MKLTKENVYIDLRGKSKEELTELCELFKGKLTTEEIYINIQVYRFLTGDGYAFYNKPNKTEVTIEQLKGILEPIGTETLQENVDLMGYSVLVDNEEQARKLQELAFEQGFMWVSYMDREIKFLEKTSFQFGYNGKKVITYNYGGNHYQDNFITKKAHFNDLFKAESLQEKEQRLLKELEEVRKEIEDSKVKVGDWCKFWDSDESRFIVGKLERVYEAKNYPYFVHSMPFKNCIKITDESLLKTLDNL